MKILDVLRKEHIKLGLEATNKSDVINELLALLKEIPPDKKEVIKKEIMEREAIKSTGIGHGIAIPHTETETVEGIHVAFGISKKGVDFLSLDGDPVHVFILVIANKTLNLKYLSLLAHIVRILSKKEIRERLLKARSKNEIVNILKEVD